MRRARPGISESEESYQLRGQPLEPRSCRLIIRLEGRISLASRKPEQERSAVFF